MKTEKIGKYVIVRANGAGVNAGNLESVDDINKIVVLKNARWLWYWSGAATLSELAVRGTSDPENCKFPCEVKKKTIYNVLEIIEVEKAAETSIKGVPVWTKQ